MTTLPTVYFTNSQGEDDYNIPLTPIEDPHEKLIAYCCKNPLCNCTCTYMAKQLDSVEVHSENHCDNCHRCLVDHHAAETLKELPVPNWLPGLVGSFLVGDCKETYPVSPIPDWVAETRSSFPTNE